jgi:acyl-CoA reductase-like NAD-dependent aldehyde dehydrogenase
MFENINPADTRDIVGRFPLSTSDDVNAAVNAAQGAFDRWRNTPAPKRAELLFRLGEILIRDKDQFTADMTREMGKVLKEAGGDVQEAIDCTYYTAGEGRRLHGFTTPAEMRDKFAMCVRQPVGLCGLITPWNFPMAIPSWKLIPADLRQHRRYQTRRRHSAFNLQPGESLRRSRHSARRCESRHWLRRNCRRGDDQSSGTALISFTGSTETGRIVASACAERNAICSLEMGGKNAIIVMDDADIDLAVEGAIWGAFGTSGQRCTASSRLIVHKKVYKQFVTKARRTHTKRCASATAPIRRPTLVQ